MAIVLDEVKVKMIPRNNKVKKLKNNHLSMVQSQMARFDLSERESIIFNFWGYL